MAFKGQGNLSKVTISIPRRSKVPRFFLFHSEGRRKEGRFSRLVTFADQTLADQTLADQTLADGLNFSISHYKSPLNREEGPVGP